MVITTKERKKEYNLLLKTTLFMGCTAKEIEHMLICLKDKVKKFDQPIRNFCIRSLIIVFRNGRLFLIVFRKNKK